MQIPSLRSVVILVLMIAGFAFVGNRYFSAKPCVQFAQKEVPDENDGSWLRVIRNEQTFYDGETISWNEEVWYEHRSFKELHLLTQKYFSKTAYKSWWCGNDGKDWSFAIYKDGKWKVFLNPAPGKSIFMTELDEYNNPIKQIIAGTDTNGQKTEIIITRRPQ